MTTINLKDFYYWYTQDVYKRQCLFFGDKRVGLAKKEFDIVELLSQNRCAASAPRRHTTPHSRIPSTQYLGTEC